VFRQEYLVGLRGKFLIGLISSNKALEDILCRKQRAEQSLYSSGSQPFAVVAKGHIPVTGAALQPGLASCSRTR